ncbi:MAG: Ig-like domain-containing protein, partial [Clostridia bacterium]|nr:Ig-like domain-containing protein [Clostridia bacterium]
VLIGANVTLTPTVLPENATNKAVRFASSNEAVFTVDGSGKVSAVGEGTATLTVTTEDGGKSATCDITVLLHASLHAMTSAHHVITLPMMSYLLYSSYRSFVNTYAPSGYLPYIRGEGGNALNVNLALREQVFSKTTDATTGETVTVTWFDYFANEAVNTASSVLVLCEQAKESELALSEAEVAEITSTIESFSLYASYYGYATTEAYLAALYGNGIGTADVRQILTLMALANKQAEQKTAEIQTAITAQDVQSYYEEHGRELRVFADFLSYTFEAAFPAGGDAAAKADYTARVAELEARANALAEADSAETFLTLLRTYLEEDGMTTQETEEALAGAQVTFCHKNNAGVAAEWLFAETPPAANDARVFATRNELIDAAQAASSSFTVCFVITPPYRDEAKLQNVGHILFLTETFQNMTDADTLTGATKTLAERVLAENKPLSAEAMAAELIAVMRENGALTEKTDEQGRAYLYMEQAVFEAYGKTYTEDGNVFYANVKRGDMVAEFEAWLYDPQRANGEISAVAVKTVYGYHIMYYGGEAAVANWEMQAFESLVTLNYNAWYQEIANETKLDLYSDVISLI